MNNLSSTTPDTSIIWIAWERHRRTISLCSYLKVESCLFESNMNRIAKYPWFIFLTISKLCKIRPEVLIVQSPSVILALIVTLLKPIFRYKLIVDAHNAAILPEYNVVKKLACILKYINYKADLTIVTNEKLARIVTLNKGKTLILPDKLPEVEVTYEHKVNTSPCIVVYICTFSVDEPFLEMLEASKSLPENISVYVTGSIKKAPNGIYEKYGKIVNFTDFLPDSEYWNLLQKSSLVIDLTTREDCLVCGAYEAVSVVTPLLLSDTRILRKYFYKGALFTDNTVYDLIEKINIALDNLYTLGKEVALLKGEIDVAWEEDGENLRKKMKSLYDEINVAT